MTDLLSERKPALHARLRSATADAHQRLETSLALLQPPLLQARFLAVLQGFWGFLRIWEPMLEKQEKLAPLLPGRSKLNMLERDLAAFGMTSEAIEALPLCWQATALAGNASRMLGGLYVMEGSTLGGQVIDRKLQDAPWAPAGGVRYFNPYGPRVGAMWRGIKEALDLVEEAQAQEEVIAGAQDHFVLLHEWLAARLTP